MSDLAIASYLILAISGCVVALLFLLAPAVLKVRDCVDELLRIGGDEDRPCYDYAPEDDDELCKNGRRRFYL